VTQDRTALRKPPVVERRSSVAGTVNRSAVAASVQPRLVSQNANTPASRSVSTPAKVSVATPVSLQFARVSHPNDPAELEARETARKVMQNTKPSQRPAKELEEKIKKPTIQRSAALVASTPSLAAAHVNAAGGSPLPSGVRSFMEPRFGANFSNVRIHTEESAAQQSSSLNAHAFTYGQHVFFGRNKFEPESSGGRELIAHELTHTIQQGAVIQRSEIATVTQSVAPEIQRSSIIEDGIAERANLIPGFRLLSILIGYNPINKAPVAASGANILSGILELSPGIGTAISAALNSYGIMAKVGSWLEGQIKSVINIGSSFLQAITQFVGSISAEDVFNLSKRKAEAEAIISSFAGRVTGFAKATINDIIDFVRDAVLMPLAKMAEGTRGYDLLRGVLGKDPITKQDVTRTPEVMIGGFMKFIKEDEVWDNIQKSGALAKAWAWFQKELELLMIFVNVVPGQFIAALKALAISDLLQIPTTFGKLASIFLDTIGRFSAWAGHAIWTLLEIVIEAVKPGALLYIKKTGAALKSILKNPLPFVGNLVNAAKAGLKNFGSNFFNHLKAGLFDWLTGSLPGVYIPKSFALVEIAKFALSVLGLSWENIKQKLIKAVGPTAVQAMETGFDIVKALVTGGPAAMWEKIKEQLTNLKDMVIGGITDFVVDMVVKTAIPKLVSMFIPGAGFITAIISIYQTVTTFIAQLSKIGEVVIGFIDSIVAIAAGAIGPAAAKVESILAKLLSLAINLLAGFAGFGKVSEKIMGVINKVRAPIDKALDWLINWIVGMAKKVGNFVVNKAKKLFDWAFAKKTFQDGDGKTHTLYVSEDGVLTIQSTPQAAKAFLAWYVKEYKDTKNLSKTIEALIGQAQSVADEISKIKTKSDEVPAPEKQRKLLELNTKISELFMQMIGDNRDIGKLQEKYLLEGRVGTYAGMPKPVGDQLTPDHQPQASVISAAADFFEKDLGIDEGNLANRARSRAAQGYAINLHFKRHVAGATYGSKGEKRAGFYQSLVKAAKGKSVANAKTIVVGMLRDLLKKDVNAMKAVAQSDVANDAWSDIREAIEKEQSPTEKKKLKQLKKDIEGRIVSGQNQIANQPFDF
jgi:Domain of unknown function (DUF4157)